MATLDELRLQQLLRPLEGPSGIASLNPLAFQFQNQLYPQSNNTMAKNIMSNFETQLYPQSEEMRDAQILMNRPDYVKTNRVEDPAFSILNLAGYDYDPYLATKDPYNYNYDIGTRPAFLRTNTPLDMNRFQGVSDMSMIDETTNDEQDQEYIDQVEKSNNPLKGILDFIGQFSPVQMIGKGIGAFFNPKGSDLYRPSTTGVFGYTPAQLNQMNALGGFYSEPERERRRRANRISNMLNRAAVGKNYSKKNLSNLMNQFGMGDVDTGRMIDSIRKSSDMGYGRGDVGQAATPDRDYSSSPGAMAGDMEYGEE
jgi:hypothetical protein